MIEIDLVLPIFPLPSPWLQVTEAMKKKNMEKPYDGKKSAWVPDKSTGGYLEGLCENDMKVADWEAVGKKVNVVVNGKSSLILMKSNNFFNHQVRPKLTSRTLYARYYREAFSSISNGSQTGPFQNIYWSHPAKIN